MSAAPTTELIDQVVADVGLIARAWAASEGNHRQQAQVAAAALRHFLQTTSDVLVLLHTDAVLATEHHQPQAPEESVL